MKPITVFFLALIAAVATTSAAQASEFTISELPTPAGLPRCNASRINDAGQVVGGCWGHNLSDERAVLWENGKVIVLPVLPGFTSSWASSISSTGQIVGYATGSAGFQAMLWSNGSVQNLGLLPGTFTSFASGINSSGVIVGFSDSQAVEWIGGQILDFGGYNGDRPSAISDKGVFVGFGVINQGDVGGAIIDVGSPGAPLRYLAQSLFGSADDINNFDEVAGFNRVTFTSPNIPWTWHYGRFTYLPFLAGSNSCEAVGINRLGDVVGFCEPNSATLWRRGVVQNLGSLIQANSHWELQAATTLNSSDEIVGDGKYRDVEEAFIIQPTHRLR